MFTAEDILDIAIRLENNGEKTYREAGRHTSDERLKSMLAWIAQEECNHARWFSELKARLVKGEDHHLMAELSRALVEDVIQGQVFSLEEVDFSTIDTPHKMVDTFIGFEDDTISFYELLKSFIDDPTIAGQVQQIIEEEKNHMTQFGNLLSSI